MVGLLVGGLLGAVLGGRRDDGGDFGGVVDETRFQAVILSNDKVYFGKLAEASDGFFRLDDAFFLREAPAAGDTTAARTLVPVNREIHAPDNTMLIRKDAVVLVENLAVDSEVLQELERQVSDR